MSSRQSLTRRQNISTMRPVLGTSSAQRAICVHLEWTNAAIIRSTAQRDSQLQTYTVDVRSSSLSPLQSTKINIKAGTVLYFVRSQHQGWYYLVSHIANAYRCSCPDGLGHQACQHQSDVLGYVTERRDIITRIEANFPDQAEALIMAATLAATLVAA